MEIIKALQQREQRREGNLEIWRKRYKKKDNKKVLGWKEILIQTQKE